MIAKMQKAYIATRSSDRRRLLEAARNLGVVHLVPVEPKQIAAPPETVAQLDHLTRAIQVLSTIEPVGQAPDLSATDIAEEVRHIEHDSAEKRARLFALARQGSQLAMWGNVRLQQFDNLSRHGLEVSFYSARAEEISDFSAQLVHVIQDLPGKRLLVAAVGRPDQLVSPEGAKEIPLPATDLPTIRDEADTIEKALAQHGQRLAVLAGTVRQLTQALQKMQLEASMATAQRGGLIGDEIFALQGWLPVEAAGTLASDLAASGVTAGVQIYEPEEDETPPTLIRYPRWTKPIKGLFDMLGTDPGYREYDLSAFFMIAFPLFAAMLIGDAGYGLVFVLAGLAIRRKLGGNVQAQLLVVLGLATFVWGLISGSIFGISPSGFVRAGGIWASVGTSLRPLQLLPDNVTDQARALMKISFIIAAVHLSLGQIRQAIGIAPNLRSLANLGWATFLWGIFGIIWYLFFGSQTVPVTAPHWTVPWLLGIGATLVVLFTSPSRNLFKTVAIGIASFPLSALNTFSDSMSYIRLMGVGLASTIIAQTFNNMGSQVAEAATWAAGGVVVVLGHALNIGMCVIAVLAHGVRLNMLEFSNNAGVQWAGYAYKPFGATNRKES